MKRKVLFFGFDCASWKVLEPLLNQGELPNLNRLIKEGVSCVIRAFDPPISPVLWTSIATGKLPDKHGIKDFLATSRSIKCKSIWDILGQHGCTIGLFGHFLTWPPKKVKGFNIPIILSQSPETYPSCYDFIPKLILLEKKGGTWNFLKYIKYMIKSFQTGVHSKILFKAGMELLWQRLGNSSYQDSLFKSRFIKEEILSDIFIWLYLRYQPDYSFFHCHIADTLSHNFWMYHEPEKFNEVPLGDIQKYRDIIPKAYRLVDSIIGRFLKIINSDTLVIVASDHGAQANVSLKRKKFYLLRSSKLIRALGLTKEVNVVNLNLGALMRLKSPVSSKGDKIIEFLKNITIEGTNERAFNIQSKGYNYIYFELNPDIDDIEKANILLDQKSFSLREFVRASSNRMSGTHDIEDAILILRGKGVRKGIRITENSILDIVPTILAWMNLPIARDMDGKVINKAFENSFFENFPLQYIDSYETGEELPQEIQEEEILKKIREELKGLGYLD